MFDLRVPRRPSVIAQIAKLWSRRHQPSLLIIRPTRTLVGVKQMFFLGIIEYSSVTNVPVQENRAVGLTCAVPQFKYNGLACSYCTDVDITP
ncbi:hypothetical protein Y032_0017g3449 [Ancylostoma ceylanicum]|uniref:Uncharacterized protein n=1 Tax=Ancylostoma ceylanicum TaxID=53326 RepID=A0A016V7B7_9BILA|nr:hypothetical protein Y032_0017g3449 [Ancylostoma ceylanicum]